MRVSIQGTVVCVDGSSGECMKGTVAAGCYGATSESVRSTVGWDDRSVFESIQATMAVMEP